MLQNRFEATGVYHRTYLAYRSTRSGKTGAVQIPRSTGRMCRNMSVMRQGRDDPPHIISREIFEHEEERQTKGGNASCRRRKSSPVDGHDTKDHYNRLLQRKLLNGTSMSRTLTEALERRPEAGKE